MSADPSTAAEAGKLSVIPNLLINQLKFHTQTIAHSATSISPTSAQMESRLCQYPTLCKTSALLYVAVTLQLTEKRIRLH